MKLASAFFCFITLLISQLTGTEKSLAAFVDKNNSKAEKLLEKIVNINSGTMNFAGVRKVYDTLAPKFKELGFSVRWEDGKAFNRAGHLIAEHRGKGKKILLIGHLDTVFEEDSPFQKYEKIDENTVKGPGVDDMKGGDIVILLAMQALYEAKLLQDMNITVVMTGDEELSGSPLNLSKKALVDAAKWADIAIGFENGDGDPMTGIVSRRSSSGWTLKVTGNAAHSSQVFTEKVGTGAIYETARILNEFYVQLSKEKNLTFNPGMIIGGTTISNDSKSKSGTAFGKANVVAKDVYVHGDIRAVSKEQLHKAQNAMKSIVAKNYPQTSAEIVFNDNYPPLAPTEANQALLKQLSDVSKDLGFGQMTPVNPRNAGAADVSFTADYVDAAIDGLGLGGANDHTVNEIAYLNTLPMQAKRAAILIHRLTGRN